MSGTNSTKALDDIRYLMSSKLSTKADVEKMSKSLGVSIPTIYRYKKNPEWMPFGIYLEIRKYFEKQFTSPDYILPSESDFIEAEERRLIFERNCADGERYTITPVFSVTCEIEEVTRAITSFDYPQFTQQLDDFLKIRSQRRKVFESGVYKSYELIDASKYRDFYLGVNRFKCLSPKVIKDQILYLIETTQLAHVDRRIYLFNTPELPVISCYRVDTKAKKFLKCLIRADDFIAEFTDEEDSKNTDELQKTFNKFFSTPTNLSEKKEVIAFLENPLKFPLF